MSQAAMKGGDVPRYTAGERANHWTVAILFILLTASGLAFFHPSFYFLAWLLGGGPWARILHPFLGVLMFLFFLFMMIRYWDENKIQPYDREWGKRLADVINNRDHNLPEIGKYNLGQKQLFWVQVVTMFLLLISGIVLWRPYFAGFFPIWVVRLGAVVHAVAAFVLILGIIVHVYAAFWVKGSLRAMTRGTVSHAWARHHHPLWYRKVTGGAK
ncbi:MAG: formate dehydrogenase subunit gamma [Sutterellaceae bacterium]|nr:formate dehydrogenase subunit gamma [Burkholderiaceae bacterium]MDW8430073.1 formate dehydrogenase subunit gamma [Sutterellaceae bacterium]